MKTRIATYLFAVPFYTFLVGILGIAGYVAFTYLRKLTVPDSSTTEELHLILAVSIVVQIITLLWKIVSARVILGTTDKEIYLSIGQLPSLHSLIIEVSSALGTKAPEVVAFVAYPFAGASERIGGNTVERELTIGWPLIRGLTQSELKAVIAHELAHFDNDAFLFHRLIWQLSYMATRLKRLTKDEHNRTILPFIEIFIALYVIVFYMLFFPLTSRARHQFELYCDSRSASIFGSNNLQSALAKLVKFQVIFWSYLQHNQSMINQEGENFFCTYLPFQSTLLCDQEIEKIFQALKFSSSDSHPSFELRIGAISHLPPQPTDGSIIPICEQEATDLELKLSRMLVDELKKPKRF